jgi:hypothetical protein
MSVTFDATKLNAVELDKLLGYLKKQKLTTDPRYKVALEEHVARHGRGLTIEGTLALIRDAVREQRWLFFKDISDDAGKRWGQGAMGEVNAHLGTLCAWAANEDLPMFSAWVVAKTSAKTGRIEGASLKAFLACARSIGLDPGETDAEREGFIEEQRKLIRKWAEQAA